MRGGQRGRERDPGAEILHGGARACAFVSGAVSVTPVPVAPAVPTVWIVPDSPSMTIGSPAAMPVTLATLMFVAPAAAAAESVVLRPWVPTLVIVTRLAVDPQGVAGREPGRRRDLHVRRAGRRRREQRRRARLRADRGDRAVSAPIRSVSPTMKLLTLPTLRLVSPAAAGSVNVVLPAEYRNWRVSL